MSSSFWLLGVESRDFSHAEKERTACKAEHIHKMTIIFNQNGPRFTVAVWTQNPFTPPRNINKGTSERWILISFCLGSGFFGSFQVRQQY
jgi:hypothetical protein